MVKIIIAYDNNDGLDDYFSRCQADISSFFDEHLDIILDPPILIPGSQCNSTYINSEIPKHNSSSFLFIGYSHGNPTSLRCNGGSYVRKGLNTNLFSKSFFYTNSCLSGQELGVELIREGCYAFIGFVEEIVTFTNEYYNSVSINCENSGLKTFMVDKIPVTVAFERMKRYFTTKIDKYESIDPLFAAQLVKHREALILHTSKDISKEDLIC
ncbi:MAG: hypothetical protein ACM3NR_01985 [Methanosarcina sp.]